MFSDYSGVQVFIYPVTIFYWISSNSILLALSTLLSVRVHFLPITFWGVLFVYVAFVMMKLYTMMSYNPQQRSPNFVSEYWDSVIKLHIRLFLVLMMVMVFFVLAEFLNYFYGIKMPVKQGIMLFFRLFTVLLIVAYYVAHMWLKPYLERRYSIQRSMKLCYSWLIKHPLEAIKYTGMLFLIMIAAVRLYVLLIGYVYNPMLLAAREFMGINLQLDLLPIDKLWSVFYNLAMLSAAFMLSNLCFYPIVFLAQLLAHKLNPIVIGKVIDAKD